MNVREEELDLSVDEGEMAVFLYRPDDGGPRPAIVMMHDALGLSEEARAQGRWLAEQGYVVAMPDTFHRAGRLLTLDLLGGGDDATPRIRRGMTNGGHRSDLARLAAFLREQADVDGRVGLTGFCLGGRISFLGATLGDVFDATAAFYPTRLLQPDPAIPDSPWPIHDAAKVTRPLLMFFPELDAFNPRGELRGCAPGVRGRRHERRGRVGRGRRPRLCATGRPQASPGTFSGSVGAHACVLRRASWFAKHVQTGAKYVLTSTGHVLIGVISRITTSRIPDLRSATTWRPLSRSSMSRPRTA